MAKLAGEVVLRKPCKFPSLGAAILERLGRWTPPGGAADRLLKRLKSPALRQLYLNWQTAKVNGVTLPSLSSLDPARFGLGPHFFTAAIENKDPLKFWFLSVGSALTTRLGRQRTRTSGASCMRHTATAPAIAARSIRLPEWTLATDRRCIWSGLCCRCPRTPGRSLDRVVFASAVRTDFF